MVLLVLGFAAASCPADGPKPSWVVRRPLDTAYYIGIARSPLVDGYAEAAKLGALSALASEIALSLDTRIRRKLEERNGEWSEDYRAEITARTRADLEGHERVDQWMDGKEYWVYYRLSRETYRRAQESRRSAALERIRGLWARAGGSGAGGRAAPGLREEDFGMGLGLLARALEEAAAYAVRWPLAEAPSPGPAEIESRLRAMLSGLRIAAGGALDSARALPGDWGMGLAEELVARVTSARDGRPIADFPVAFAFVEGIGDLSGSVRSGSDGRARARVRRLRSPAPEQQVRAEVDWLRLPGVDTLPEPVLRLLRSLGGPSARFDISVRGRTVHLRSEEANVDGPVPVPPLGSFLKAKLSREGFLFVEDSAAADVSLAIRAAARAGSAADGLHFAYLDFSLSMRERAAGREIFSDARTGIKGGHLDYPKAGLKAYEAAVRLIASDILPQILGRSPK